MLSASGTAGGVKAFWAVWPVPEAGSDEHRLDSNTRPDCPRSSERGKPSRVGGLGGVVLELDAPPWCLLALEVRLEKIEEIAADLETKLSNGIGSVHA
jgi:hypothetical protein